MSGYRIIQHEKRFKFGTDAVILQNFANLPKNARAADLGTGTGILPILICARMPGVTFEAVEIQEECAEMAQRSVVLNGLEERIKVHAMDLKDAPQLLGNRFDAVLCNPPYGKRGGVLLNPNDALAIARHEIKTDLAGVIEAGAALLKNGGKFYLIHQADRLPEIAWRMHEKNLPLKRVRLVQPSAGKRCHLVLIEAVKGGNYNAVDRTEYADREEAYRIHMHADVFLTSANAISLDGQMVNIDGTGNRVSAIVYGPASVIVIAGMNKVTDTLDGALTRARTVAAPMNQQRFLLNNPCSVTATCADCKSETCICNQILITRHCRPVGRIKFILVGEELGL